VHQAPAYGEDDQIVCAAAGIPTIVSLDAGGRFTSTVPDHEGELWSDANKPLIQQLRADGRLLRVASYEHSYPHCWRCRNPLIYKAVSSWFVRVAASEGPALKDRMGELNQQITWVPENVKDGQFGKWVENARDWSVSRNRYWGTPIPVWKSDDDAYPRIDVYGSLAEIEADFGRVPVGDDGEPNLHRPYIDDLTRPNPDDPTGQSTMRRIEDVFDVWFDSGSMPYAQVHYPFENREWFDGTETEPGHNPADFIVEYIGQTRGWFYVMHVLATALFDRPAFSNVISHGIVLGSDGQKMSKSLRNYPDVSEVFDRDGADAMRWFLMSSSVIRGGNLVVTEEGIREGVRQFLLPLWSTYYFFTLYANASTGLSAGASTGLSAGASTGLSAGASTGLSAGVASVPEPVEGPTSSSYIATWRTDSSNVLDRYLLAKTRDLIVEVQERLDELDSPLAAQALRDFADVLTNWYVRRSRDRFWEGTDRDAFDTLYTVLETVSRVAAPLAPLVTEEIWQGLTGGRSVHLEDWPDASAFPSDEALVTAMDEVRDIASASLALRKAKGLRVRLPLARLTVVSPATAALEPFTGILENELNVKAVALEPLEEHSLERFGITRKLTVNARALGPRLGKQVQQVIQAAKAGDWTSGETVVVGGIELLETEYELELQSVDPSAAIAFLSDGGFVILDTETTPALEAEGLARDAIRAIQDTRKQAGLDVSDRIRLVLRGEDATDLAALEQFRETIAAEVLATELDVDHTDAPGLDATIGSAAGSQRATLAPGQYANAGTIVIDVWKAGAIDV
jgi:isoleucyl-tRNA synthetase